MLENNGVQYATVEKFEPIDISAKDAAEELRNWLADAVSKRMAWGRSTGCWISGGLDSSALTALASIESPGVHTFAVGMEGSQGLEHARSVSVSSHTRHHERVAKLRDMLKTLPQVIYHLESFDALLVRSSVLSFMAREMAPDYVGAVLSGEGAGVKDVMGQHANEVISDSEFEAERVPPSGDTLNSK